MKSFFSHFLIGLEPVVTIFGNLIATFSCLTGFALLFLNIFSDSHWLLEIFAVFDIKFSLILIASAFLLICTIHGYQQLTEKLYNKESQENSHVLSEILASYQISINDKEVVLALWNRVEHKKFEIQSYQGVSGTIKKVFFGDLNYQIEMETFELDLIFKIIGKPNGVTIQQGSTYLLSLEKAENILQKLIIFHQNSLAKQ